MKKILLNTAEFDAYRKQLDAQWDRAMAKADKKAPAYCKRCEEEKQFCCCINAGEYDAPSMGTE